jgi:predicted  nucleic acid-binding Zn-ribbon protein
MAEDANRNPNPPSRGAAGSARLDRKCRNGDTGRDLYRRKREIEDRLADLRERADRMRRLVKPIEEEIEGASMELLNVDTRINVWRQEQNASAQAQPPEPGLACKDDVRVS